MQPNFGSSFVPSAALINHSCDPNVHHLSEGSELVIRSLRKIEKNEELTISYINPTQSFEDRQIALSGMYAFSCQCRKCAQGFKEQAEVLTGDFLYDASIRNAKQKLHSLLDTIANCTESVDDAEKKMQDICDKSLSGKPWPVNAYPLANIYQVLFRRLEAEQQWEMALRICLKIVYVIDPYRFLERLNPHRVEQLMALCQLERYVP